MTNKLAEIYEEVMWLARRPGKTPANARAWYTHVAAMRLRRDVRRFTGQVSKEALNKDVVLRLEHFLRIQTTLTQLIRQHLKNGDNSKEFIEVVLRCEQVNIVTLKENYDAMKAKGDYEQAGIVLVKWDSISQEKRSFLWKKMLFGKVSNANEFPH